MVERDTSIHLYYRSCGFEDWVVVDVEGKGSMVEECGYELMWMWKVMLRFGREVQVEKVGGGVSF